MQAIGSHTSITSRMMGDIERYLDATLDTNPLFVGAKEGTVTPEIIGRYVTNVTHLVAQTQRHLNRAAEASAARGLNRLADWFNEKVHEEAGHDQWGEEDKQELSRRFAVTASPRLLASTRALVGYISETIDYDPNLYLIYMLLAESGAVRVGPVFIRDLELRCGIPHSVVSILGNHAELDREHVQEDLAVIEDLLSDDDGIDDTEVFSTLRKSMELIDGMHADVFRLN